MMIRLWLLFLAPLLISCSVATPTPTLTPAARPKTTSSVRVTITATPVSGSMSGYTEKVDLNSFSPPGAGRDLTIMNCDYCHSWVCAIRGGKTLDHWIMVEEVHRNNWRVILSDQDWDTLFTYLERNFNDKKPEPQLPPAYRQVGCAYDPMR